MLNVYLGDCENEVYNPPVYFINQYEDAWLETQLAKDIDKSKVVGPHLIQSPVLGPYLLVSYQVVSRHYCYLLLMKVEEFLMQLPVGIIVQNGY